jgi:hypothetical protein
MANEFVVKKGLQVKGDTTLEGDLTVNGTTTTVNTATLDVEDANITVNKNGDQAGANSAVSGITVEMSDATDAKLGYDSSTTSKFKCGESGSESEVATISAAQVITNKDFDGGTASDTSRITIPKNTTANLDGLTRKEATIVWDSTLKKMKVDDGTSLTEVGTGAGGGVNYITNGTNPVGVTGWTESADGSFDIAVNTTDPLRDAADFSFAKAASDESDEYIAFDFDLEPADVPALMMITADIDASDANYADDDLKFALYDLDESEYVAFDGEIKAGKGAYKAFVQTHATSTNYELRVVVNSANTSAYTVYMTNISFSPAVRNYGAPVTDWESYTPTVSNLGAGSGSVSGKYRRVGDSAEITIKFIKDTTPGSDTGTPVFFSIPSGLTIDRTKTPTSTASETVGNCETFSIETASQIASNTVNVRINDNNRVCIFNAGGSDGYQGSDFRANSSASMTFKVPISGWSSSVRMSDTNSGREITASYKGQPTGTLAASDNLVTFPTKVIDKAAAYSSGLYTLPESGSYRVKGVVRVNCSSASANQYFNLMIKQAGTIVAQKTKRIQVLGAADIQIEVSTVIDGIAGQEIGIYSNTDYTTPSFNASENCSNLSIEKIQGPSAIGATEVVACELEGDGSTATSIPNATWTKLLVFDAVNDSHNAWDETDNRYNVPYTGWYDIQCQAYVNSDFDDDELRQGNAIYIDGVQYRTHYSGIRVGSANQSPPSISIKTKLNKGQYIEFYVYQQNTDADARTTVNVPTVIHASISKLGGI